jgi:hypothetical protein
MKTLFDNVKVLASLVPAVRTADANGTGVDTQGYRDGMMVVSAGDIDLASADETYVVKVQESDDNSSFADVSGLTGTITADNGVAVVRVRELNVARKRYLRAALDVGGTTPSIPCAALFLLGEAYAGPVNTD